jgi:hypothetical protein
MAEVTDARLANVRAAQRTINAARGAERHLLREPDDAKLEQMLARVHDLAELLEGDRDRWGLQQAELPLRLGALRTRRS